MPDIFDTLLQAIEENAFPLFYTKSEYRRMRHCIEQQAAWLEAHLSSEQKLHLEELRQAELCVVSLECDAQVKIALAAGVRLALPG